MPVGKRIGSMTWAGWISAMPIGNGHSTRAENSAFLKDRCWFIPATRDNKNSFPRGAAMQHSDV